MKRLTVFLLFIILIASFLSVIVSTNVSTKGADEQEKIKALVAEYPDNFVETEIPNKITYTIASAKSEKYSAQLCFIDNKGQILYSKNGKKLYKSDTEKKLRKIMNVNKEDILDFYDMTHFDGIFYICFMKIVKINALEGSVSNGPYIYYIAETSDFKNYQVHEMETEDSRYIGLSVYLNNAFPYLYKSNDIFYYIYRNCYVSARTSEDEDTLDLNIPFGYYGNSLDSLKTLKFEGTIDYDHEIFPKGMDIRVWPVIEGSKIRLELYEDHDFRDDIYYNPYADDNFLLE
ncbi:MAG: hypothetical protein J6Z02_08370, partial [Lachnospiraceae bacterium]|nr:hypothetical protein [Lachnospiraceae bacterium]